jgi:hypothetical protein
MTNEDPLMDDEQAGDAVAKYLEEHPELIQEIAPPHDLWPAIERRISARVIPMQAPVVRGVPRIRRSLGWMPMLIAASALVVASAGVTYVLTTRAGTTGGAASAVAAGSAQSGVQGGVQGGVQSGGETGAATPGEGAGESGGAARLAQSQAGDTDARGEAESPAVTRAVHAAMHAAAGPEARSGVRTGMRLASRGDEHTTDGMRQTYDSEITTLHRALEARRGQLNPATVEIIEQNLSVIDEAIRQSRAALAADPNSRLLNDQLDRTLAKKTILLRAAALLPSA